MRSLKITGWLNGLGAGLSLAVAMAVAASTGPSSDRSRPERASWSLVAHTDRIEIAPGRYGLRDAGGAVIELRDFRRIASGSLVADGILAALVEPDRVIAYSSHAHDPDSPLSYRYAGTPTLPFDLHVEKLLALNVEVLVFNGVSQAVKVEQLRRAGIVVFDLGEMRGVSTLLANIRSVGVLLGVAERAERVALGFERRMRSIAVDVPVSRRKTGMYIGLHGDKLFGAGRGTSYDDVLTAAGLINVAAKHHDGWPRYTPEHALVLDPDVIVTQTGMSTQLCSTFGLERLRACHRPGGMVELPMPMLVDPGLVMLDTAEEIHRLVYAQDAVGGTP